jgi:maleate isomerase
MLIPSSNTSIEREYPAWMPPALSFHFARLTMTRLDAEGMAEQLADMRRAVASLRDARVDAVLLCQTAASYWMGRDWDTAIRSDMAEWSGAPALTAAATVLDALAALGARRVAFAAPFPAEIGEASLRYLDASGIEVVNSAFGELRDNFAIAEMAREDVLDLALRADHPQADVLLMPGGNMPCLALAEEIEARIGKPMVSTNQAGMWALLSLFGLPDCVAGAGWLLRERPPMG